jgi:hypothetical protein
LNVPGVIVGIPPLGDDAVLVNGLFNIAVGLVIVAGLVLAGLVLYFAYRFVGDTFRFGTQRYPLSWFIMLSALFSAAGLAGAGPLGLSMGPAFLAVYAIGRWRARVENAKSIKQEAGPTSP